jgi:hypothetical protein
MNNVLQFNARPVEHQPCVYRMEVNGVERGQRVLLWHDRYQRLWLEVSQCGQVIFRMEPLGRVN